LLQTFLVLSPDGKAGLLLLPFLIDDFLTASEAKRVFKELLAPILLIDKSFFVFEQAQTPLSHKRPAQTHEEAHEYEKTEFVGGKRISDLLIESAIVVHRIEEASEYQSVHILEGRGLCFNVLTIQAYEAVSRILAKHRVAAVLFSEIGAASRVARQVHLVSDVGLDLAR